jgi:hypothetical protein
MPIRSTAALVALLGLLATVLMLRSSASAQDSGARTFTVRETERGATFTHIRNTKRAPRHSNLAGDVRVFTNPIVDASGKRIGKTSASCVTTTGARNFMKWTMTCAGVMELADGSLTLQVSIKVDERVVTGGTGAYANARGVITSTAVQGGTQDVITLAP